MAHYAARKRKRKPNYMPVIIFFACFLFLITTIAVGIICIKQSGRISNLSAQVEMMVSQKSATEETLKTLQEKYDKLSEDYEALKKAKAAAQNGSSNSGEYNGPTTVYLTFDDGPSKNTEKVLDILKQYNVKATFFSIGNESDYATALYKRIIDEGHTLANHTYNHTYSKVYASTDAFWSSVTRFEDYVEKVTGKRPAKILRFPGGSNNTVSEKYTKGIMKTLTRQAKEKGYQYYDWNVSSNDAAKALQDKNVIINSVLNQSYKKRRAIVLFHDAAGKTTTVEALPAILDKMKERGCIFAALDETVEPVQFLKVS